MKAENRKKGALTVAGYLCLTIVLLAVISSAVFWISIYDILGKHRHNKTGFGTKNVSLCGKYG